MNQGSNHGVVEKKQIARPENILLGNSLTSPLYVLIFLKAAVWHHCAIRLRWADLKCAPLGSALIIRDCKQNVFETQPSMENMAETLFDDQLKPDMDVICFSHLRWDFVYQRPQHLMSRFAREKRVFILEEPVFTDTSPQLDITPRAENVYVAVPKLPHGFEAEKIPLQLRAFLGELLERYGIRHFLSWYYTPMMFEWSRDLEPLAIVYDCMDQLSAFKNAPPELTTRESELIG